MNQLLFLYFSAMMKKELRKEYREKRANLPLTTIQDFSKNLVQIATDNFELHSKTVSLFISIQSKKEIDTAHLLDELLQKDCTITVSKSDLVTTTLSHYIYEGPEQLAPSTYDVPEPKYGELIDETKMDIVFVPLLCFDQEGYRVGYGKGFYDRFLSKCRPDCLFIGLSLFDPIEKITDTNEYDIPLDYCIMPNGLWKK